LRAGGVESKHVHDRKDGADGPPVGLMLADA
jgi:hypothetical protein